MNSYIDREFDHISEPAASTGIPLDRRFILMVAASILVHLILSAPFFINGRWSRTVPAIPLVDLSLVQSSPQPAATAPPQPELVEPPPAPLAETPVDQHKAADQNTAQPAVVKSTPDPLQQTSFGLGISRGYFKSIAEGQTLRSDIKDYYFAMLEKINESWWANSGQNRDGVMREPLIDVWVARNGEIINKSLLKSSGNPAYDREILRAVDAAAPLPALPESFDGDIFQAPVRLVAPRGLMLGSGIF